jgi:zona occludens toxin (predicted ATPase)
MTIELITGTPGAGKTTFAVAERLRPESERDIDMEIDGQPRTVRRRLFVAGIGGLLVEHEKLPHTLTNDPVPQAVIDYFNAVDSDGELVHKRLRGEPPVPIPDEVEVNGKRYPAGPSLFNWWLWVEPGDMIAVDEVQYIVPRGTVGKKPPAYIALLEVHRHYGVDFLFITQHPQLLDTTIRNLVGLHRHIRAVMASRLCMVYTWDHASNPERFNLATKSQFLRGPKHYRLFKSAAGHVKPPSSGRAVLFVVPLLLLLVGFMFWRMRDRLQPPPKPGQATHAPAASAAVPSTAGLVVAAPPKVPTASDRDWPTYIAEPYKPRREPLDGRAVEWEGGYTVGTKFVAYFGLLVDGQRVTTLTLSQLLSMGYTWTTLGPCVGSLRFGQVERLVTCAKRVDPDEPHQVADRPAPAASLPLLGAGA